MICIGCENLQQVGRKAPKLDHETTGQVYVLTWPLNSPDQIILKDPTSQLIGYSRPGAKNHCRALTFVWKIVDPVCCCFTHTFPSCTRCIYKKKGGGSSCASAFHSSVLLRIHIPNPLLTIVSIHRLIVTCATAWRSGQSRLSSGNPRGREPNVSSKQRAHSHPAVCVPLLWACHVNVKHTHGGFSNTPPHQPSLRW